MDIENVKKVKNLIRHASAITVNGFGETFLHPRLQDVLEYIYSINEADNLISIVTNGTALTAEKASWFSGHLRSMAVSLNASNAEAYAREMHPYEYEAGKDVSGKFDRLIQRITAFSDALKPDERSKIHLHYVVHSENVNDLADFVRLAYRMQLSTVNFTHLMVHRPQHINRSIYWIKDLYNDAVDDAIEVGKALGVSVGARKFFAEHKGPFVPERDCTWPHDTVLIGARGKIVPCCYWGVEDVGNAFAEADAFDKVWFGEFYNALRRRRTAFPCTRCNILRVFDDITLHFSPAMKSDPAFADRLGAFQEMTAAEIAKLTSGFDQVGLDLSLHRWVLRKVTGSLARPQDVQVDDENPLRSIEIDVWDHFRHSNVAPVTELAVDLSGRFIGLGWGPAGSNQHGQTWRWLGGHGQPASVLTRLKPGRSYCAEFMLYTAKTAEVLDTIVVTANGIKADAPRLSWREPHYYFSCVIPAAALDSEGYLCLAIDAQAEGERLPGAQVLALTSLHIWEADDDAAPRIDAPTASPLPGGASGVGSSASLVRNAPSGDDSHARRRQQNGITA